jgi:hypothetical protein
VQTLLQPLLQVCGLFILATPLAIIAWIALRWWRDRQAALRPGWYRLLAWIGVTVGGFMLLMFGAGGHKASPEVEFLGAVWLLVLTVLCARWLWTLYQTIGLPRG